MKEREFLLIKIKVVAFSGFRQETSSIPSAAAVSVSERSVNGGGILWGMRGLRNLLLI